MEINPVTAAQFYNSAKPATKADDSSSGGEAFREIISDVTQTLKAGEETAQAAMTGDADIPSLVTALAQSELAIETAVTIRDKVVEAYQEILRMPV